MKSHLPFVFAFVLGLAFLLLLVTFRSIVVPLKAIVLNLLSVGAAYGVLTWVFQDGHFEGLLNFKSVGGITRWLPLFLFVILFGLSMDYHVFILSRIREAVDGGMSDRRRRRARHQVHGRRRDQRGGRDDRRVRDLRDAVDDRVQADGRRPRGGDPGRRDAGARGPAPGRDEAARGAQLVPPRAAALVAEVGTRVGTGGRFTHNSRAMRIGVLTGGGDCPGLNAVIRAIVRKGNNAHGHEFVGFRYGWAGVLKNEAMDLTLDSTRGILHRGGTILGSSRTNPYKVEGGVEKVAAMKARGLDALIPIGGEDTLGVAGRLHEDGINVVGVPKTIDNDLAATDFTFGFQTAVQIATDAIDRLHTTAESHNRVIIVEVMGRHAGWIALYSGMAGGADVVLIPERPFDIDEVVRAHPPPPRSRADVLDRRGRRGRDALRRRPDHRAPETDAFGHVRLGGIAVELEKEIEARTGLRVAHDDPRPRPARRHAAGVRPRARHALRRRGDRRRQPRATSARWSRCAGTDIERVPLREALAEPKLVDPEIYETAEVFFG